MVAVVGSVGANTMIRSFVLILLLSVAACSSEKISSNEHAMQQIQNIPEFKEFVDSIPSDVAKPYIRAEVKDESPFYEFYVGTSLPTHTVLWKRFRINRQSGEITVYDDRTDEYVTLDEWAVRVKLGTMPR